MKPLCPENKITTRNPRLRMSATITPVITTNIHRKLLADTAAPDSTKTTNPLIIATAIGTGLIATRKEKTTLRPVKEWG